MRPSPRNESRLHVFVLAFCVTACLAVGMWPTSPDGEPAARQAAQALQTALKWTIGIDESAEEGPVGSRVDHRH